MKAFSVREPWASLIVEGKKTLELRSWRTHYRGTVLVHRSGRDRGLIGMAEIAYIIEITSLEQFRSLRDEHRAPDEFYQDKLFGWVLRNAKPIDFIPRKGQLGIWEVGAGVSGIDMED
jgi:hypothetical protein